MFNMGTDDQDEVESNKLPPEVLEDDETEEDDEIVDDDEVDDDAVK